MVKQLSGSAICQGFICPEMCEKWMHRTDAVMLVNSQPLFSPGEMFPRLVLEPLWANPSEFLQTTWWSDNSQEMPAVICWGTCKVLMYKPDVTMLINSQPFFFPRPPGVVKCEAHWRHPGQPFASSGAAAEAEPPRVLAAVCKAAAENDGPQADRHGARAASAGHQENRDRHEPPSPATRDLQGLVLMSRAVLHPLT